MFFGSYFITFYFDFPTSGKLLGLIDSLNPGLTILLFTDTHSCHKLQINRKYCLHPFEAKRVQILYISSHIKEGFYIERENFE